MENWLYLANHPTKNAWNCTASYVTCSCCALHVNGPMAWILIWHDIQSWWRRSQWSGWRMEVVCPDFFTLIRILAAEFWMYLSLCRRLLGTVMRRALHDYSLEASVRVTVRWRLAILLRLSKEILQIWSMWDSKVEGRNREERYTPLGSVGPPVYFDMRFEFEVSVEQVRYGCRTVLILVLLCKWKANCLGNRSGVRF